MKRVRSKEMNEKKKKKEIKAIKKEMSSKKSTFHQIKIDKQRF